VVVFNESLQNLLALVREDGGPGDRQFEKDKVTPKLVYTSALKEAMRVMKKGDLIVIKPGPGNGFGLTEREINRGRREEAEICEAFLKQMNYEGITVVRSKSMPVLIWAWKPGGAPVHRLPPRHAPALLLEAA
jgi:hypothetical protein